MRFLDLKAKFAIVAGAMILTVAVIITTFLTKQQERTIREELLARALALTENLAYNCQLPLAAENRTSLGRLAQGLLKQDEVSYVEFQSTTGEYLAREGNNSTGDPGVEDVRDVVEHGAGTRSAWVRTADGRTFVDVQTTVVVEGEDETSVENDILATNRQADVELGRVRVGLTTAPAQQRIAHLRRLAGLLGLAAAVLGSFIAAALIHVLTRPMSQLMEGNRRVARGDFSLRLEVRSGDEFGRLAGSYNQMADEIQRSHELADSYLASLRANAERLEEANRALQQSNAELAKASRMKSEFLAVMSHELRTPLNVIIGFSEVLLDEQFGKLNPKQARYADNVLSSGRHLLSLINDILDLSKVEAGRMKVAAEPFDLKHTIDEIHSLVRNLATRKDLEVKCAEAPALTPITDPKIFRQVMLNLLSNAIKFTPAGGKVEFGVRCIDGRALRSDAAARSLPPSRRLAIVPRPVLVVEVRDTGIGIAAEDHEKIFHAFQQVDASYARRQEGTGLGLALSRKLVTLLGGDIWFTSVPNEGTTFWFYVPFAWSEATESPSLGVAPLEHEPDAGDAKTAVRAPSRVGAGAGAGAGTGVGAGVGASTGDGSGDGDAAALRPAAHGEWPWGAPHAGDGETASDAVVTTPDDAEAAAAPDASSAVARRTAAASESPAGRPVTPSVASSSTPPGPRPAAAARETPTVAVADRRAAADRRSRGRRRSDDAGDAGGAS
jgi:signal transduction histidine kinase